MRLMPFESVVLTNRHLVYNGRARLRRQSFTLEQTSHKSFNRSVEKFVKKALLEAAVTARLARGLMLFAQSLVHIEACRDKIFHGASGIMFRGPNMCAGRQG